MGLLESSRSLTKLNLSNSGRAQCKLKREDRTELDLSRNPCTMTNVVCS